MIIQCDDMELDVVETNISFLPTLFALVMVAIIGCRYSDKSYKELVTESAAPFYDCRKAVPGMPCAAPMKAELLDEDGSIALFSGLTAGDLAANEAETAADRETPMLRNSLFIRCCESDGTDEWRLLLTTGTAWREGDGMNEWCKDRAREIRECFMVLNASLSNDGRSIWLVCNSHSFTYNVVSKFDLRTNTFRVIGDGDSAEEQPDGTILVRNKKSYRNGKNGEPLGSVWYDEWIAPDGTVVRKTEPKQLNN